MTEPIEVDDAIDVALRRTDQAEHDVKRATDENAVPPKALVDKVVQRADDLEHLARQAAGHEPDLEGESGR
jgi:hypothetical protein